MTIDIFESYEEQMMFFADTTNVNPLPMTKGRSAFFIQLGNWFRDFGAENKSLKVSYILPNPAQCMSFPTAFDVLSTVLMMYRDTSSVDEEVICLLIEFGLNADKAGQPIASLSGGELLLLSYAKAKAMLPTVDGLVACSPVHWLNKSRYKYWDSLVTAYKNSNKSVNVALLEGESFPRREESEGVIFERQEKITKFRWKLLANNPKVVFPEIKFPSYHPESSIQFSSDTSELNLTSPTLITGDNGIGKSILAKLIAGIIKPDKGSISSLSENGKGEARLIFQDSIDQIFGMSIDNHIDWVFKFDGTKAKTALTVYSDIDKSLRTLLSENYFDGLAAIGEANKKTTLLQAKICLVAERIASSPPLLILDEPGWGLSKTVSRCFLWEVCKQAHSHGVAIAVISHQPNWWNELIHSHIELTQCVDDAVKINIVEMAL